LLQANSFITDEPETTQGFTRTDHWRVPHRGRRHHDKHNKFYDELPSHVMDMPAEFYLSTVQRILRTMKSAQTSFTDPRPAVDIGKITDAPV